MSAIKKLATHTLELSGGILQRKPLRLRQASVARVLTEIDRFSQKQASFGFETTPSRRSYLNLVQRLKEKGYRVYLFFLFV